ncbi:unnamed protein product [Closterium sp. Naga37s-1]|nr:unnamed protein product [Closterium sp. Naga37s-1]
MNKQIAAGRKPADPVPVGTTSPGGTSFEAPRDVPSCVRRGSDRVASTCTVDDDTFLNEEDESDYNEYGIGTDDDDDSGDKEDKGMSDDDDEAEGDDDEVPEEAQPEIHAGRHGHSNPASGIKTAAKGGDPPRRAPKTRDQIPVKRSCWSQRENAIFVAARWFTKDEVEPLIEKQGSQYWARLVLCIEKENPDRERDVNAEALAQPREHLQAVEEGGEGVGESTPTSNRPRVAETAIMAEAKLVCFTIKGCHVDAMSKLQGLVRAWMQQDELLASERMQQTAPAPPPRYDVLEGAAAQPATAGAEGADDGWYRHAQPTDGTTNQNAGEEEVWVRGVDK